MKKKIQKKRLFTLLMLVVMITSFSDIKAQSYYTWYKNAQQRIDTLRKGDFGIQIFDKDGQPFTGNVSVRMKKHEFPFGIAFDFYEGSASMGNSYTTDNAVQAEADSEIYQVERWNKNLGYSIPVDNGKEYKLTLKFAEIYATEVDFRLFDVFVEGQLFLDDYDMFKEAGGQNIAVDTSIVVLINDGSINIELNGSKDNAAIKGIVVEEVGGEMIYRINCGGSAITTTDGNSYIAETGFFDPEANTVASKEQWMQAAMYKYFNYGVSGNSFKWSGIQPNHTAPNYNNFDNAVRWTQKVGWDLRAHTLLWGGNDAHSMPDWVRNLPTAQDIMDTCQMRVVREMTRYKGIIKEYDVMNEPLSGHADWLRNTVGDSVIWNSFKWARSADPDAKLFVNDYNVEYNWGQAAEYRDLVLKMKEMGAPVTGVGMQAHFWECCRPNVDELVKNINIVAEAGLPIRFTEYDYAGDISQAEQASDFIKVLTVAYSHPSITGFISWGLSDDGAWRENTGFFDAEHKPKLAADTLLHYTKKLWATNFDTTMVSNSMDLNAYYGDYEIEVEFDGVVKVFTIPCLKENEDSIFVLNETDAKLKGPEFLSTELVEDNQVRVFFDKPIVGSSLVRSNFKFFSNTEVGLLSVERDPDNENAILLSLSKDVTKGDYISVSYFPGSMMAADGSIADAFGPEAIANPDNTVSVSIINDRTLKIYPNPATDILNIEYDSAPYQVSVFNSIGVLVHTEMSYSESFSFGVNQFNEGLYLIRIKDADNNLTTQKVLFK